MTIYGQTIIPTVTPTPTPTPSGNATTNDNKGNMDSNSTRPQPYRENSTSNIMNNSINSSTGLGQFMISGGYTNNVRGFLYILNDYAIIYVLFGMITFLYMFMKRGN
jgi:hypothetical protein